MGTYTRLTVYTDGASRGNPGPAAAGIHIVDDMTSEAVVDLGVTLGIATNNVAEYQAVLQAVAWLLEHKELLADDIHISFRLDSSLVVSQLSGLWEIKACAGYLGHPFGKEVENRGADRHGVNKSEQTFFNFILSHTTRKSNGGRRQSFSLKSLFSEQMSQVANTACKICSCCRLYAATQHGYLAISK
jgi:ribonuclease HI